MALADDIRILSGVPLLQGFTAEQLRLLAFGAERLRLEAGGILFAQGEPADGAFVLVDGALELVRRENGRETAVSAKPGALLGELALIVATERPAEARALVASDLLKFERKSFRRILEEYPELAAALHQRIAGRLVELAEDVGRLAPRFSD